VGGGGVLDKKNSIFVENQYESKKGNDSNPPPQKKDPGYVPGDVLIKIDF